MASNGCDQVWWTLDGVLHCTLAWSFVLHRCWWWWLVGWQTKFASGDNDHIIIIIKQ